MSFALKANIVRLEQKINNAIFLVDSDHDIRYKCLQSLIIS